MNRRIRALAATLAIACASLTAHADEAFPSRPVKMVVGFAPGGPTDVLARILATAMSRTLGQQVVVENRAGAGGAIGTDAVAKAPKDGYTVLFSGDGALAVLPQLATTPYDPQADLVPLRLVASQVNVLVSNASKGLPDMPTLLARAKASPGALTFGSAGGGTPSHLVGALMQSAAGIELTHVPYKGAGPAMTDLLGGQIDLMFVGMPVALQNAARKELKLIAVTGDRRSPALPDLPTFAEVGLSGLGNETGVWWALMAPSGTPPAIQAKLVAATRAALADPEARKTFATQGVDLLDQDAQTVSQWIARDHARWAELIRTRKIARP